MRSLARKQEPRALVTQEFGTVVRADGAALVVETDAGELRAKRAKGCLLEPEAGDLVLVAVATDGRCYVLSVLEREDGAPGSIVADGDLNIKLPAGRLGVAAQDGIGLVSAKEVAVVSAGLSVNAVDGNVALQRLSFVGTLLRAEIGKAKVLAGSLDSVLERLSQRVKRSYRTVEESEQLRAERVDYVAKKTMSLRGENTLVTAQELVKIDGEQIHLG
ncbi:DUF3540 domain-containing protein [Sorangium sp. So ce363]|uniref:DUF3540 domain-containing protein n=1 Tax=Sorangium sp. So ce363 TaxID=3133304 RepID=UPI003F5F0951